MSDVQRLNYCTHAIEDLRKSAMAYPPSRRQSAARQLRIAELLDQAVKFLLPERGELVDLSRIDEATLGMLRLPFPLIALEVPFPPTGALITDGPMKESLSTRRIVLAWDESFAAQSGLSPVYGEPGIYVVSVYYADEERAWMAAPMGIFLPLANRVRLVANHGGTSPVDALVASTLLENESTTLKSPVLDAHYFEVLPQLVRMVTEELGYETAMARMQLDVRDELMCVHGFCLTVNCVNVGLASLPAEEKLNAKRIRSGKLPLYEYKVLDLPEPKATSGAGGSRLEGQRNAPRTHLRRGHPRRLPDGRLTFVRAAVIGASNIGVVQKDYSVRR